MIDINSNLNFRQTDKLIHEQAQHTTELINSKDKTIESMNSEINLLKVSLNEVMEKDKKIQELKNELTLLNFQFHLRQVVLLYKLKN